MLLMNCIVEQVPFKSVSIYTLWTYVSFKLAQRSFTNTLWNLFPTLSLDNLTQSFIPRSKCGAKQHDDKLPLKLTQHVPGVRTWCSSPATVEPAPTRTRDVSFHRASFPYYPFPVRCSSEMPKKLRSKRICKDWPPERSEPSHPVRRLRGQTRIKLDAREMIPETVFQNESIYRQARRWENVVRQGYVSYPTVCALVALNVIRKICFRQKLWFPTRLSYVLFYLEM